ncbi:DUF6430 domain-containing protein [Dactylosporangium sp. AC04546]|uniref:macro domain-containing protein n=1 Tax=Dactylosporangium sp. AC04546 TaxID=2862460 RepID=UPI001EDE0A45|nr:macro domain-containing protein [Dactylosporangium sp. AC04546]WVK88775.1 DUF6430 domain-containing protein [Dactylosporangium sp. AC04546]
MTYGRYEPVHCTIVSIDVAGSAGRDDQLLLRMRADLQQLITHTFTLQGLDPAGVDVEDLGDGVRIVVPAEVTPVRLLDPFVPHLAAALREHRKVTAEAARLRLRVAVHMGLLHRDAAGWAGEPLVHSARLLDAPALRRALAAAERADLAVIVSGDMYQKVVRHGYGLDTGAYHRVPVAVKETRTTAWVHVPGYPSPPGLQEPAPARPPAPAAEAVRPRRRLRRLRFTRGTARFSRDAALAAGALSSVAATAWALTALHAPPIVAIAVPALPGLAWAVWRGRARSGAAFHLRHPDVTVTFRIGDLFDEDAHIVVGFTDTFDTSTAGERIVASSALQGQLIGRRYDGDQQRLDRELTQALSRHTPASVEKRDAKRLGKLTRYPIGTVAVLGGPGRRTFATAYSRMGNDLVPRSSVDDLWRSLSSLWDAVYEHGQRLPLAMPVVGSGAARIDRLGPQGLLEVILLSFVARSRELQFCRELRIVIRPADVPAYDIPSILAFLRRL